jgi:hypothetical protein
MTIDSFKNINQAQLERLSYIDFRLDFFGEMNRADLVYRFGIKDAAATRDITLYRSHGSHNVEYDNQAKIYLRRNTYKPLFPRNERQILSAIALGFGDDYIGKSSAAIPCESSIELGSPDLAILASITRAIHQKRVLEIDYLSLSSGESNREIIPHSLANNGFRLHVRAYDRKNNRFADFVINRITSVEHLSSTAGSAELAENDLDWNDSVELQLVPHPNVKHIESINKEYSMTGEGLIVMVKPALAGYTLRRWNVDCSTDHRLTGGEHHLWLKNTEQVADKASLAVAPGYTNT